MNVFKKIYTNFENSLSPKIDTIDRNLSKESLGNLAGLLNNSGKVVSNEASIMGITAFYKGLNTITSTLAMIPFKVYQKDENGNNIIAKEHPINFLIKEEPNSFQTPFSFYSNQFQHQFLKGNSFAKKKYDSNGFVESLDFIEYNSVTIKELNGKIYFNFDTEKKAIAYNDLIHFKGFGGYYLGKDIITNFQKTFDLTLNANRYANNVYESDGANSKMVLKTEKTLTDTQIKRLRTSWNSTYGGVNGQGTIILEEGFDVKSFSLSPEQTKFFESRNFQIKEIARILNCPPFVVGDYSDAKYSNIEQQVLDFLKTCLMPEIVKIEQELTKKLLSKDERINGYFIKGNIDALLRGDTATRAAFYKELFYLGSISPDEIRKKEEMEGIDNEAGKQTYIQANLIPSNLINDFYKTKIYPNTQNIDEK